MGDFNAYYQNDYETDKQQNQLLEIKKKMKRRKRELKNKRKQLLR